MKSNIKIFFEYCYPKDIPQKKKRWPPWFQKLSNVPPAHEPLSTTIPLLDSPLRFAASGHLVAYRVRQPDWDWDSKYLPNFSFRLTNVRRKRRVGKPTRCRRQALYSQCPPGEVSTNMIMTFAKENRKGYKSNVSDGATLRSEAQRQKGARPQGRAVGEGQRWKSFQMGARLFLLVFLTLDCHKEVEADKKLDKHIRYL